MDIYKTRGKHRFSVSRNAQKSKIFGTPKLQSIFLMFSKKSQARHIIILAILGLIALVALGYFIWRSGGLANFYLLKIFS